jgi:hypothetical protein
VLVYFFNLCGGGGNPFEHILMSDGVPNKFINLLTYVIGMEGEMFVSVYFVFVRMHFYKFT